MKVELLNRYRWFDQFPQPATTYFTLLPYVQVRVIEHRHKVDFERTGKATTRKVTVTKQKSEIALCLAWFFWSIRFTWNKPKTPEQFSSSQKKC